MIINNKNFWKVLLTWIQKKIAFDIISLAGDAKAELQAALKLAHQGKLCWSTSSNWQSYTTITKKLMNCKHKNYLHVKLMVKKLSFNVLISHAQDYLMTTYILKDMVIENYSII